MSSMTLSEIKNLVRSMNVDDDENDYVFKSAVILIYGITFDTVSVHDIRRGTYYSWKDVDLIIYNFRANGIIQKRKYMLEYWGGTDLEMITEITLCAMAGSGDIMRSEEDNKYFDEDNLPISRAQLVATGRSSESKLRIAI